MLRSGVVCSSDANDTDGGWAESGGRPVLPAVERRYPRCGDTVALGQTTPAADVAGERGYGREPDSAGRSEAEADRESVEPAVDVPLGQELDIAAVFDGRLACEPGLEPSVDDDGALDWAPHVEVTFEGQPTWQRALEVAANQDEEITRPEFPNPLQGGSARVGLFGLVGLVARDGCAAPPSTAPPAPQPLFQEDVLPQAAAEAPRPLFEDGLPQTEAEASLFPEEGLPQTEAEASMFPEDDLSSETAESPLFPEDDLSSETAESPLFPEDELSSETAESPQPLFSVEDLSLETAEPQPLFSVEDLSLETAGASRPVHPTSGPPLFGHPDCADVGDEPGADVLAAVLGTTRAYQPMTWASPWLAPSPAQSAMRRYRRAVIGGALVASIVVAAALLALAVRNHRAQLAFAATSFFTPSAPSNAALAVPSREVASTRSEPASAKRSMDATSAPSTAPFVASSNHATSAAPTATAANRSSDATSPSVVTGVTGPGGATSAVGSVPEAPPSLAHPSPPASAVEATRPVHFAAARTGAPRAAAATRANAHGARHAVAAAAPRRGPAAGRSSPASPATQPPATRSAAAGGDRARTATADEQDTVELARQAATAPVKATSGDEASSVGLGRADVRRGMESVRAGVDACYARYRVAGVALVAAVIDGSGRVRTAETRGALARTPTGDCIRKAVRDASFPRFTGAPVSIWYPFVLK